MDANQAFRKPWVSKSIVCRSYRIPGLITKALTASQHDGPDTQFVGQALFTFLHGSQAELPSRFEWRATDTQDGIHPDPDAELNLEVPAAIADEATTFVAPPGQSNRGNKRKRLSLGRDTTLGSSRNSSPAPSLFTEASTESTAGLNCPPDIGTQRARFFNLSQEGPIVMGDEEFQRYWPFVGNIFTKKDTRKNKTRYLCLFNKKKAQESASTGKRIKASTQRLSFIHSQLTL